MGRGRFSVGGDDSLCSLGESGITIRTHALPRHHRSLTVYANNADAGTLDPFRLCEESASMPFREIDSLASGV
jgi:hypothetical protein